MKRRDFLQKSALMMAGIAVSGIGSFYPRKLLAADAATEDISLDILTADPDAAIREIEQLIKSAALPQRVVKYQECRLSGVHTGDIALVKNGNLLNFREAGDDFSRQLREISRGLSLPRAVENPFLLRFYSENRPALPGRVSIIRENELVAQLAIAENTAPRRIESARGYVDIAVRDQAVHITAASCKHKTCMNLGAIRRPGERLVCIPNQIAVTIEGRHAHGVDGITF